MTHDLDVLQPIAVDDLKHLKQIYKRNWPRYCFNYYYIEYSEHWIRNYNYQLTFYAPNGDWSDGTYVVIPKEPGKCTPDGKQSISCGSLESNQQRLQDALLKTKRFDWQAVHIVEVVHKNVFPTVMNVLIASKVQLTEFVVLNLWWISSENARKFEAVPPDDMYFGTLNVSHVDEVNDVWVHKYDGSRDYIKMLIEKTLTVGLFEKRTGKLASWILRNDFGCLGILQTKAEFQRRGFGCLVTKKICQMFAEMNVDPCAFIVQHNRVSANIFRNLGFEIVDGLGVFFLQTN